MRPEISEAIKASLHACLTETDLGLGKRTVVRELAYCACTLRLTFKCQVTVSYWPFMCQGKVRDTYEVGDKLVIVTTDRQSAFDRILASIPFKVTPALVSLPLSLCNKH